MCTLLLPYTDTKQFTGYKIAIKHKDNYYSPYTGLKYKPGKVKPLTTKINERFLPNVFSDVLDPWSSFHNKKMKGKTSVIKHIPTARHILKNEWSDVGGLVILKMTIKGDLMNGKFDDLPIVAGNEIISFEEVQ